MTPYFAPAYVYGGPPRSILGLCQGLQATGVDVEVLTTTANGRHELPASPRNGDLFEGVHVRYVRRSRSRLFFAAPLGPELDALIDRADLCHVHGLWNAPEWIATRTARTRRVPYIISPRGMLLDAALAHHGWRKRALFRLLEAKAIESAARLHATSVEEARQLTRFAPPSRIVVSPNGVDVSAARLPRPRIRHHAGLGSSDHLVLFLGRIHPMKRIDLLAEAVAKARETNDRVRLVIAGPDEKNTLRSLKPVLSALGDSVSLVGEVDESEKWAWIHEAAVLVCCSDSENFGLSVAEAMAAGRPVVVTRTCPWPDVERAGAGFWVEQRVAPIAAAILAVIGDPQRARQMGERGGALIDRSYSWAAIGRQMTRCYEDVLRDRRASVA